MKPRIKICGLRRVEDAELALSLGADYLGCVMAGDSPRCATIPEARAIVELGAAAGVPVVLAFRNNTATEILDVCLATGAQRVQVHGVDPRACAGLRFYGLVAHPVFRVDARSERLPRLSPAPTDACPGLLDTGPGGTGTPFAWRLLGERAPASTLIAGGISPRNVASLMRRQPFGIDVSSGIEVAPGTKDPLRMRQLFSEVAAASRSEVSR